MRKFVIYRRCSTRRQGESGLGLDAQDRDISLFFENYCREPYKVVGEFTDIQSGKDIDREELHKAVELARKHKAELLVSKLDRLSRRVKDIATFMDDDRLTVRVASMPNADRFSLHIYAALAEQEREFISLRTKQALAAAASRGKKLGGLRDKTMVRNLVARKAADAAAKRVSDIIMPMREGGSTLNQIASALNSAKVTTPRGRQWTPTAVRNALLRLQPAA